MAEGLISVPIALGEGVALLFFIGFGILLSNLLSVPVPTSMTTVGAIAGLGLSTDALRFETIGWIATWWVVAPLSVFFIGLVVGRYFYPALNRRFRIQSSEGPLLVLDQNGTVPTIAKGPNATREEVIGTVLVLTVSCYMAFSAGASNIPNAVAPLVSSGALGVNTAIILATGAIGVGAFTIARRTIESVGTELTDISLFAALIVMLTASSITAGLSYLGVPIRLVMATVMIITGLGWGRATRPIPLEDAVRGSVRGEIGKEIALNALAVDQDPPVAEIGEAEPKKGVEEAGELFDQQALARYISMWIIGPSVALMLSYAYFSLAFWGDSPELRNAGIRRHRSDGL